MSNTNKETHIGIVSDNVDPEKRGRIRVRCGTILKDGAVLPDWIEPMFPYLASSNKTYTSSGWFFIPDVGVAVEIELSSVSSRDEIAGMISFDAGTIRWRACLFAQGQDDIHPEFLDNYPQRKGIVTSSGHALIFDDTPGDAEVKILQVNQFGNSFMDFNESGSMVLSTSKGMLLYMNQETDGAGELTLLDNNQNILVMNSEGFYLANADSSIIQAIGGDISLLGGTVLMNAGSGVTAKTASFIVTNSNPAPPAVLTEGATGFQGLLQAALSEIGIWGATVTPPYVPVSLTILLTALGSNAFSSQTLSAE